MTTYLTSLLGHVASYGLRADHAARVLVQRTIDEFSLVVCQKTGLEFEFLTRYKDDIMMRVMTGNVSYTPRICKGKTQHGTSCKKMTLMGYCHEHQHQETTLESKKRRVDAHMTTSTRKLKKKINDIVPLKFKFV